MKPCLVCGALADGPRCRTHELAHQRTRSASRTWYHGTWQSLRKQRKGICVNCGRVGPTELDHIQPRSLAGGVRELCPSCHRALGKSYKKFTT